MDLVRVKLEDGTETNVGASFAKSKNLTVLKKPALDKVGRPIRAKYPVRLRGSDLDAALEEAGLPKAGSADEKRARLAEHIETTGASGVGDVAPTTAGGESAQSKEDSK